MPSLVSARFRQSDGDTSVSLLSTSTTSSSSRGEEGLPVLSGSRSKAIFSSYGSSIELIPTYSHNHPKTSLTRAFTNLIKGTVGAGMLAMPDAIKNAGLFFGTAGLLVLGAWNIYSCMLLLQSYLAMSDGQTPMSYTEATYQALRRASSRWLRRAARPARYVVNTFLVLGQLGICCVFILFAARMIKEVVDDSWPDLGWELCDYASLVLVPLVPFSFIATLKAMSIFSLFANIAIVVTLGITLQYVFQHLQPVENVSYGPPSAATVPLSFGTALYSFECIAMILPIENQMEDRSAYHGWNALFSCSMAGVVCVYAIIGFYGYLAFGVDSVMILSNLPPGDWLYKSVKLLYGLAVFLSYNVQLYALIHIMYPSLKHWVDRAWFDRYGEYLFRTCIVLFTYALTVSIPCLELMISLTGSLAFGSLGLIFPPLMELVVCCFHNPRKTTSTVVWTVAKCSFLALIGLVGCTVGSAVALQAIIAALQSPEGCPA